MAKARRRREPSRAVQQAINRWIAEGRRAMKRRRPADASPGVRSGRLPMQDCSADGNRLHENDKLSAPGRGRGKSRRSLDLIEAAAAILREIQPASIRAVCYRLFSTGHIESMAKSETNRVSAQLTYARERGVIPWHWIVDETREAERVNAWEDPADYVEAVKRSYRRDRWTDQPAWIEVWSEKGTVRGTLAPVLHAYGVTFRVMHGYASATAVYQAADETRSTDKLLRPRILIE